MYQHHKDDGSTNSSLARKLSKTAQRVKRSATYKHRHQNSGKKTNHTRIIHHVCYSRIQHDSHGLGQRGEQSRFDNILSLNYTT